MRILPFLAAPLLLAACGAGAQPVPSDEVTGTMFVANKRGASLSRIDLASGAETLRAETCANPHELTVSPDAAHVMVACYSGRSVEIYATADLFRVQVIELGEGARVHSALWLADGRVIAGAEGRGSLYVIEDPLADTPTLTEIGSGEQGPHLLAVDRAGTTAWGTIIPRGEVVRYDLVQGVEVARARVGEMIEAIALSPDGEDLWVSSNATSTAFRLDPVTLEVQDRVATGQVPIRLAAHPGGGQVVSSNFLGGDLTVFDTATAMVARTIPVSGSDAAMQVTLVFSPDGQRLYAAETATDTVAEIDFASGEVLRRIPTGPGGDGLAVVD